MILTSILISLFHILMSSYKIMHAFSCIAKLQKQIYPPKWIYFTCLSRITSHEKNMTLIGGLKFTEKSNFICFLDLKDNNYFQYQKGHSSSVTDILLYVLSPLNQVKQKTCYQAAGSALIVKTTLSLLQAVARCGSLT